MPSDYVIDDHPYCRGYFDAVEGRRDRSQEELCDWSRSQYQLGWDDAIEELTLERSHGRMLDGREWSKFPESVVTGG